MRNDIKELKPSVKIKSINALIIIIIPFLSLILSLYLESRAYGYIGFGIFIFLLMYILAMIGLELGFHRYFTHKAFKTTPVMESLFAILGSIAANGPVLWWVGIHRFHHSHSDHLSDPHSPNISHRNFIHNLFHAHIGWLFDPYLTMSNGEWTNNLKKSDLRAPIVKIHFQYKIWVLIGILIPGLVGLLFFRDMEGFITGILWGGPVRIFCVSHSFWSINSICHKIGSHPYTTTNDNSKNNIIVAILTFGQGWHNNHHAYPMAGIIGNKWWQIDIGANILWGLQRLGLVWDIKKIPKQETEK